MVRYTGSISAKAPLASYSVIRYEPRQDEPALFTIEFCVGNVKGQQAIAYYRERYNDKGIFENEVYPGIQEVLAGLKAAGRKLAVASSKPGVYVERILEHFALGGYFDAVVGSELDGTRTQKEEVVEEALRRLLPAGLFQKLMDTRGKGTGGADVIAETVEELGEVLGKNCEEN